MFSFLLEFCNFFCLIYDICDYLVMADVFYDIVSIINVLFLQFKFYHGHH